MSEQSQPPECCFPGKPGPAGHIPACQLCPNSPTYWRNTLTADERKQVEAVDAGRYRASA